MTIGWLEFGQDSQHCARGYRPQFNSDNIFDVGEFAPIRDRGCLDREDLA
jgi:hypothetical protein